MKEQSRGHIYKTVAHNNKYPNDSFLAQIFIKGVRLKKSSSDIRVCKVWLDEILLRLDRGDKESDIIAETKRTLSMHHGGYYKGRKNKLLYVK